MDVPCLQQAFSWRGVSQNHLIFERLDRAISHRSFYNAFDNNTIFYGPFTVSDHAPVIFSSNDVSNYQPPPPSGFKIFGPSTNTRILLFANTGMSQLQDLDSFVFNRNLDG